MRPLRRLYPCCLPGFGKELGWRHHHLSCSGLPKEKLGAKPGEDGAQDAPGKRLMPTDRTGC